MKKIYSNIFAACTALFVAAACTDNIEPADPATPADGGKYQKIVISAVNNTRTVMNEDLKVDWCQGDAVSAFSVNIASGENLKLSSSNSGQAHETKFEGVIDKGTTEVIALYPYNSAATYSEGVLTTEIPTEQTATVSSFGNGAAVTMTSGELKGREVEVPLEFHHLCSVIEFTLPDNINNVTSIKIESDDNNMTGEISVDCKSQDITSAELPYVILTGTMTGVNDYCVTIAPGNYKTSGFKFTITTTSGSFVREATGVEAEKGKLYNLGVLSYAPDKSMANVTASIIPTYSDMSVTGSDATLTLTTTVPSDFSGTITKWTLKNVKFSQSSTVFRSQNVIDNVTSGVATAPITVAGAHPYMPHTVGSGVYDWTADIYYTVKTIDRATGEEKTVERKLKTATGNATAPELDPDKFMIDYNFYGYTSYSVSVGEDKPYKSISEGAASANTLDNSTVYNIGEKTYKSGLGSGEGSVYQQCVTNMGANSLLIDGDTKYDGSVVSGTGVDKAEQDWKAYKISCDNSSFDGVTPSHESSKEVYVTGLPYRHNPTNEGKHPWSEYHVKGLICHYYWNSDNVQMKPVSCKPIVGTPTFYIPSEKRIPITASGKINVDAKNSKTIWIRFGSGSDNPNTESPDFLGDYNYNISKYSFKNISKESWNASKIEFELNQGVSGPTVTIYGIEIIYR